MIFYICFIAGVIGVVIFGSGLFKVSKAAKGTTHSDVPEYPERTYRIVPNEKGTFDVEEYVYVVHTDSITYLWHSSSTIQYMDSYGRLRINHPSNISLEEAKAYIAKQQIADDKRLDEIEASKAHIAANEPVVFMPGSIQPVRPRATPDEATTLASAFPDMGFDIESINEIVRKRSEQEKPVEKPYDPFPGLKKKKPFRTSRDRWPGLGKSKKFRKYEE